MSGTITINSNDLLNAVKPQLLQMPEITQQPYSYIIWTDGQKYYAKNGSTGQVEFSGTDANTVIQNAINKLQYGGKIFIKSGIYNVTETISILYSSIIIEGENAYFDPGYVDKIRGTVLKSDLDIPIIQIYNPNSVVRDIVIRNIGINGTSSGSIGIHAPPSLQTTLRKAMFEKLVVRAGTPIKLTDFGDVVGINLELIAISNQGRALHLIGSTPNFVSGNSTFINIRGSAPDGADAVIKVEGLSGSAGIGYIWFINPTVGGSGSGVAGIYLKDISQFISSGGVHVLGGTFEGSQYIKLEASSGRYVTRCKFIGISSIGSQSIITGSGANTNIFAFNNFYADVIDNGGVNMYLYNMFHAGAKLNAPNGIIIGNVGYNTKNFGRVMFNGDGTTTQFRITHNLALTPKTAIVMPASRDASGNFYVTFDATYIYVNYITAPPTGTNNVVLYWYAET